MQIVLSSWTKEVIAAILILTGAILLIQGYPVAGILFIAFGILSILDLIIAIGCVTAMFIVAFFFDKADSTRDEGSNQNGSLDGRT